MLRQNTRVVLQDLTFTAKTDVWSFGILLWEAASNGKTPYPGMTNTEIQEKVAEGYRMPAPEQWPPALCTIMLECWQEVRDPQHTPHRHHHPPPTPCIALLHRVRALRPELPPAEAEGGVCVCQRTPHCSVRRILVRGRGLEICGAG